MAYKIPAVTAISNQFPEFVKEDYPRFIRFVELYYEFLKNSNLDGVGESFDSIRDIDITLDKFIDSLWKEFGINVPRTNIANDKHFLKHIKDFYSTKGSEESFRILFRHFFNTEIDLIYPKEYILKTSDGEWIQDVSFLVSVSEGDIYDIVGKQITVSTSLQNITLQVTRVRNLNNLYEVFISKTDYKLISYGDIISFNGVVATIEKTISTVPILKTGTGFYVGQLFNIPSITGSDAKIKVTALDKDNNLKNVEVIDFGSGYQSPFYATITSKTTESIRSEFPTLRDQTLGFVDSGFISMDTYFETNIINPSYSGEILREFYNDYSIAENVKAEEENTAIITVNIGSIRKYQGYYKTDKGFLSNNYKLQDSYYYQIYSYVISSVESITKYRDIVKTLIHPTGMKLFGQQVLNNEISLISTLEILNRFIQISAQDEAFVNDSNKYILSKPVSEFLTLSEIETLRLNKPVSESLSLSDIETLDFNKPVSESLTLSEIETLSFDKSVSESLSLSETQTLGFNKPVSESLSLSETRTLSFDKYFTDVFSVLGFFYWEADYGSSDFVSSETPAIISYTNSTYSITLNN